MIQRKVFNYTKIPKKVGALGDPHRFKGAVSKTPKYLERRSDPPTKIKDPFFMIYGFLLQILIVSFLILFL